MKKNIKDGLFLLNMKITFVEDLKRRAVVKIEGETHTLANMLEKELWEDDDVTSVGYHVDHPLIGVPVLVIETNQNRTARKALINAAKRLERRTQSFEEELENAF